ncbi:DUF2442 domain-containing protein [Campylobacter corcagiensis]|uniref:DUF2442 domain-containing protein n=1 Tax=Campylobacter corcagiensis TaxID=1448857 RepID=A0A7M1LEU8_9BACT|nr:DUF2442 domain-containing protein [Campylobacter corcagiensis]QKF64758.1 DUF2442 domain-containing protein [Campylobacter corcagiensis]QOQ87078.1 DUF2442 domain-containing protein [Campylobacter corcagiensis]
MSILRAKDVKFDEFYLNVELDDGRIISTPLSWYKEFLNATIKQMKDWHFICDKTGIEWESLDLQLSVEGMIFYNTSNKTA